jgi:hypothetical protein
MATSKRAGKSELPALSTAPAPALPADRLLGDIRAMIEAARQQVARTVNSAIRLRPGRRLLLPLVELQRPHIGCKLRLRIIRATPMRAAFRSLFRGRPRGRAGPRLVRGKPPMSRRMRAIWNRPSNSSVVTLPDRGSAGRDFGCNLCPRSEVWLIWLRPRSQVGLEFTAEAGVPTLNPERCCRVRPHRRTRGAGPGSTWHQIGIDRSIDLIARSGDAVDGQYVVPGPERQTFRDGEGNVYL